MVIELGLQYCNLPFSYGPVCIINWFCFGSGTCSLMINKRIIKVFTREDIKSQWCSLIISSKQVLCQQLVASV